MADNRNSRDLAITEGRFALVLDRTKGHVETLTGPYKSSLADTQTPIVYEPNSKTGYRECESPQEAVQPYIVAKQGQYAVLYNPSRETGSEKDFPPKGKGSLPSMLDIGNTVNITGPLTFALWWQQQAEVIDAHQLKSNQFLLVEVTNEAQAKSNWKKAEIKPALAEDGSSLPVNRDPESIFNLDPAKFTLGQRIIVRGVEISSFIPPTGMRVVPDTDRSFVREAATLESQQYCVLRSENGKKRYCQGPAVVFPTATETFVEENGNRVFRCIELNTNSGIHVMVIADYVDEKTTKPVKSGTELFITGKDAPIYYPRPEHAIVKYDNENYIHYATAVPEGEGRYVLDKDSGKVELRRGPAMILLNPTKEIFVRRVLSASNTGLYYPGNNEALKVNEELTNRMSTSNTDYLSDDIKGVACASAGMAYSSSGARSRSLVSDVVQRKSSYTPPRSLTIDNKYSGAVTISIWPGYAVQIVKKNGQSRVEVGPKTVLLEYDESLTKLSLSTGKPKSTDKLQDTVYLKVSGNQVTDLVNVETLDSIGVTIKVALKVKFVSEPSKWFTVDNYVKEVCDHVRSFLRGTVKKLSILDFTKSATEIVRDSILGAKSEKNGPRPGMSFENCGVVVHDVEVMEVKVTDPNVAAMIVASQQETIRGMLEITKKQQASVVVKEVETSERLMLVERQKTEEEKHKASLEAVERKLNLLRAELNVEVQRSTVIAQSKLEITALENQITDLEIIRTKATADAKAVVDAQIQALTEKKIAAETAAIQARLKAVDPQLVSAIQASNDRDALVKVVENMGLSAYFKEDSIGATLSGILKGTSLQNTLDKIGKTLRED
jgi:major vault protein